MRILVVSSPAPSQDEDEGVPADALLRLLKGFGHAVDLVLAPRQPLEADALRAMRAAGDRVIVVPYARAGEEASPATALPPALESAVRALTSGTAYDVVIARHVRLCRALGLVPDGPVKVLQAIGFVRPGGPAPGNGAEVAGDIGAADLVLASDEDGRAFLQTLTAKPVAILGPVSGVRAGAGGGTRREGRRIGVVGDGSAMRDVSRFVAASDLDHLASEGGVLRVGGAVASRLGGVRPGLDLVTEGPLSFDDLDLLACPAGTGPDPVSTVVTGLAQGVPLIGTASGFRGMPTRAAFHAAPDAVAVAALLRRWLASEEMRRSVAWESSALAARHASEVDRQQGIFRDFASLRAALRRPRILAVSHAADHRLPDVRRAVSGAMEMDLLVLGGDGGSPGSLPGPAPGDHASHPEPTIAVADRDAAIAATRDALTRGQYDALLVGEEDLFFLRAATPAGTLTVFDAAPDGAGAAPSLDRCERLAAFDLILTRSPGQQRAVLPALPRHAWYLPSPAPDVPCPDRARPVRRLAIAAGGAPREAAAFRWFLDQAWPVLVLDGLECLALGQRVGGVSEAVPPGVILSDAGDALGTADIALNLVTEADTAHLTRDYLLHGLPCVLSEDAADAIGDGEGEAFLVARSRAECVAHVQRLVHDADWRRAMGEAAFRLGRTRFGNPIATSAARGIADITASRKAA